MSFDHSNQLFAPAARLSIPSFQSANANRDALLQRLRAQHAAVQAARSRPELLNAAVSQFDSMIFVCVQFILFTSLLFQLHSIVDRLLQDAALDVVFDMHRQVKTGQMCASCLHTNGGQ